MMHHRLFIQFNFIRYQTYPFLDNYFFHPYLVLELVVVDYLMDIPEVVDLNYHTYQAKSDLGLGFEGFNPDTCPIFLFDGNGVGVGLIKPPSSLE